MDRSVIRLPDPVAGAFHGERRRAVRQKLHTPVYASFTGPQTGMVVDLSELLDLHEEGFAVQTSERLEINRAVTLCLDLTETKSYIHGSGRVIWSDDAGRGGIRFSALPESSRKILKEWLFGNLLIACSNHAARTAQLARRKNEEESLTDPAPVAKAGSVVPISDGSGMLSAVEAVRREVRETGDGVDAVFDLIARRALSLTGASGAALAFLTDDTMICRSRAGQPAPPLGAPVDVKQGLSGECVRSGLSVSCEDTENDPRIDPEVCRALGIGSLMAAPIVSDFGVAGLLEIFSPHPRAFTNAHLAVLDWLVEMIPKTHRELPQLRQTQFERTQPENIPPETATASEAASQPPASEHGSEPGSEPGSMEFASIQAIREALWEQEPEVPERRHIPEPIVSAQVPEQISAQIPKAAPTVPSRWFHLGLLGLAIVTLIFVLGYLAGSSITVRRWASSWKALRTPVADAAPAVSGQSAAGHSLTEQRSADQRAADQRTPAKSLADLRKLADEGDADARWQMGVRCHNGDGVPRDDAQAMQWFLRAAEQGHVTAQATLGAYYWAGRGVPQDLSKAYMWSEIALAGGDQDSKSRLQGLASQMTHAQVAAANQQAEEWIQTHSQRAKSEAN